MSRIQNNILSIPEQTNETIQWSSLEATTITIGAHAHLNGVIVLDSTIEKTTFHINLEGERAECDLAIILLGDDVTIPLTIDTTHTGAHSRSRIAVRSISRNHARLMVDGILRFTKTANESSTRFSHHGLHLSNDAETRTVPSLEIQADGVDAKHEVSMGYFDPMAVWYGRTRGISKEIMMQEMAQGFATTDLGEIGEDIDLAPARIAAEKFISSAYAG